MYFRELPDPLFTLKSFRPLIEANEINDEKEKIEKVKEIILSIPENNRVIIQKILELFNKIILKGEINKMNATNCATVLAPSVLYESKDPNLFVLTVNQVNDLFSFLITNYQQIFLNPLFIEDKSEQLYPLQVKTKEHEENSQDLLQSTKILNLDSLRSYDSYNLKISIKRGTKLAPKGIFSLHHKSSISIQLFLLFLKKILIFFNFSKKIAMD